MYDSAVLFHLTAPSPESGDKSRSSPKSWCPGVFLRVFRCPLLQKRERRRSWHAQSSRSSGLLPSAYRLQVSSPFKGVDKPCRAEQRPRRCSEVACVRATERGRPSRGSKGVRRGANYFCVEIRSKSPTHHIGQIQSRRFHHPADLSHTLKVEREREREREWFHTRMDTRKNFVVGTLPMS